MIAWLEGQVVWQDGETCVIRTAAGVGYWVTPTVRAWRLLASPEVALPVALVVREDALLLYGFASWHERQAFVDLVAVPGLGPKTALAVLGVFEPGELAAAVAREDIQALVRVPGIGPKTARRLLLDLKGRLAWEEPPPAASGSNVFADSVAALTSLGYSADEAASAVRSALEAHPDADVPVIVRHALRRFRTP